MQAEEENLDSDSSDQSSFDDVLSMTKHNIQSNLTYGEEVLGE